jgi:hypothetical protein
MFTGNSRHYGRFARRLRSQGGSSLLLWLAVCALVPSPAAGQPFEALGTRAKGMGGAFVAVADDVTAVYWNPAGLATGAMFDAQVEFGSREMTGDPDQPIGVGEQALRGRSRLIAVGFPALGLSYYRIDSEGAASLLTTVAEAENRETQSGSVLRLDRVTTQNFGVSLLQSITRFAVIGATVRAVRGAAVEAVSGETGLPGEMLDRAQDLEAVGQTKLDVDAGVMGSFGSVRVGVAARNLCEPVFGAVTGWGGARLRRRVRFGAAFVPRSRASGILGPLTVSVDADLTTNDAADGSRRDVAAGIERWLVGGRLGVRAGARGSTVGRARTVGTAGVSARLRPSMFVDWQLTSGGSESERSWGLAARVTF